MAFTDRLHNRGSISTARYEIDNSCKFEDDNTEWLSKTTGSDWNRVKWTASFWVKRGELGATSSNVRFFAASDPSYDFRVRFQGTGDTLAFYNSDSTGSCSQNSSAVFRDTSAWYHIIAVWDTANATAGNRQRLYVNGVEVTDFATDSQPAQNQKSVWGKTDDGSGTVTMGIGAQYNYYSGFVQGYCGYMAEWHWVEGQALSPTDFGEYDEGSGIWKPKEYTGTYGSNGFYLDFENASDLGADASGNGNNWTKNNITAANQATDTPTNNFCTFNPLVRVNNTPTITEGGTKVIGGGGTWNQAFGTLGAKKGKWYYEVKIANSGDTAFYGASTFPAEGDNVSSGQLMYNTSFMVGSVASPDYYYWQNGSQVSNESTGWGSIAQNDVVGIALDLDASTKTFTIYKNGTALSGTLSQPVDLPTNMQDEFIFPMVVQYEDSGDQYNLGGYTIMTISSAASDENGYGTFEYAPPTGYYALCTQNLAEYG